MTRDPHEANNSAALLERAQLGDQDAIEALLALHDSDLRASITINPKWRSMIAADDVLQVTYLEAILDLAKIECDARGLGAWLSAIARNNLRDAIKCLEREKRPHPDRRIGVPPDQDSVVWLWNFLTGSSASPSTPASRNEIRTELESRILQLPATYGEVMRLVHFQGHTIAEAASAMGRTYGAVHLLHQRALDRMRGLLGGESRFFSG